jgi:branched-chain amino acid transport system permease protein
MQAVVQNLIYGIQLGSLYALIALGYTMVYGVLRLINFAHGDVYMVGAFMGYYCCTSWFPFADLTAHPEAGTHNILLAFVALLVVMAICAALGVVIEQFAYRPLRNGLTASDAHFWGLAIALPITARVAVLTSVKGAAIWLAIGIALGFALRPVMAWLARHVVLTSSRLNALITAIGVSLLLENGGLLVFGANPNFVPNIVPERNIALPGGVQVGTSQLAILVISLILMAILRYIVLYTRRGKAMRAISHDIEAAKLMGIDTDGVISFTFALGSALAGAGGALVAVLTHIKITPLFGLQPGLKAFVAAVLGGAGNIPGAVVGGLIMGVAETFVAASKYNSFKDSIAFCILVGVLLVRPAGLFGKNVAEKI